jgi:hypothetical protein
MMGATMQQRGAGKVLVIPTAELKPQNMVNLMEDMTVMCRIFEKKLKQLDPIDQMRSVYGEYRESFSGLFSKGNNSFEAMYVQGYGSLFMTSVDFPLSAPPETEKKEETKEEEADPVWKQMRQEIFSPQQATKRPADRPEEKYDPEKVENLKSTLIKALVHATNIRGLNPDESVILTVTGKSVPGNSGTRGFGMYEENEGFKALFKKDMVHSSQMVLVIRVKKSDIDLLAHKKIDFGQFKAKVGIISYPYLGGDLSRNSSSIFFQSSGDSAPSSSSSASQYRSSGRLN